MGADPGADQENPRLLATYRESDNSWVVAPGAYRIRAGQASDDLPLGAAITLPPQTFSATHPLAVTSAPVRAY
ncbi:MAG: hypothetical protein ABUS57_05515 [Pseudomonadota bacterium]